MCSKEKSENKTIPINIYPLHNSFENSKKTLIDLIKIDKVIALDSLPFGLILSEISKVIFHQNHYYILDKKFSNLLIFDSKGKFISKVGRLGMGPGEYQNINDFDIVKNRVIVYSNDSMSLLDYDLMGKYIRKRKVPFFASHFTILDNDFLAFYINFNPSEEVYNLFITDADLNIVEKRFPYYKKQYMGIEFSGFTKKSSTLNLFSVGLSDSVYHIENDKSLSLKYVFDFEKFKLLEEDRINHQKFMMNGINYSFLEDGFIENNDVLMYNFQHKSKLHTGIYFKETKLNYLYSKKSKDFHENIISIPVGSIEKSIISYVNPEYFLHFLEIDSKGFNKLKLTDEKLYQVLKEINEKSPPVLFVFSFKTN